ncbi:hypothetical protein RRG08_023429 [Elysia crispata]|uniref:Hexosyltransferase n=1 Tax=Elysia crispata TaxID=231223 RepID=A0AAE0YE73_9GAST|nr:hypothetical protein RRG08_023429 [Elysia crispata]
MANQIGMWRLRNQMHRCFQGQLAVVLLLISLSILAFLTNHEQAPHPRQGDANIYRLTAPDITITRAQRGLLNQPRHMSGRTGKGERLGISRYQKSSSKPQSNPKLVSRRNDGGEVNTNSESKGSSGKRVNHGKPVAWGTRDNRVRGDRFRSDVSLKNDSMFINITRIRKNNLLVEKIPEERHLAQNKSVFQKSTSMINSFNHNLFIDGSDVCSGEKAVSIIIIIPSVADDFEKRKAIRRTWLGAGERNLWPRAEVSSVIKHIFLLGFRPNGDYNLVNDESEQHKDIVLADFLDTYQNLTTKVLVGLQWTTHYCPQAEMVLKVDQDTLVNVPLMARLLQDTRRSMSGASSDFVVGLKHTDPVVVREGRWLVSEKAYPLPYFPVYLYGHTYAVSAPGAATRLLEAARYFPLLAPEDAFITGFLPKATGVARLHSSAFTVCCRHLISRCEVVWNQRVALTGLDTVNLLDSVWADIVRAHCDPEAHL